MHIHELSSRNPIDQERIGTIMMTTSVPLALGVAAAEREVFKHTNILVPSNKPATEHQQAEMQVTEALSEGAVTLVLLLTGAITKARAIRHQPPSA